MKKSKVILVTNIPNQYRVPLFNEVNNQLNSKGLDFLVVFGAATYQARKSIVDLSDCKFKYQILKPSRFKKKALNYLSENYLFLKQISYWHTVQKQKSTLWN